MRNELYSAYGKGDKDYEPTAKAKAIYARVLMIDSALQEASRELSNAHFDLSKLSLVLPSYRTLGTMSESLSDLIENCRDTLEEEWDDWLDEHLTDPEYFTDVTEVSE